MQQQDWDFLEDSLSELRGKNFRPAFLKTLALGGLFFGGIIFIFTAWKLQNSQQFLAGILGNLGCELIGSIVIFLAVEQLTRSLNEQSKKEKELLEFIQKVRNKDAELRRRNEHSPIVSDVSKAG